ncbi:TetR/AcrR family transcriptional regulator [Marinobacter xestospongiae]|uniref:TetR/AcrR family transcriptional regulator n=1 Tax=Marinobacter xestospongiae TaxID=994319 RepID=A0ABU3VZ07_9GAMM|nr:TetR/AcrR family transcriptional regulator [Marinobacter xestospongiae]MDV2079538.1 TetR/AcrR family transcriptional regulator [Marinobacter xestospongiae]
MVPKPRAEMIEETRAKLLATGRQHFGTAGFAATVMDDLTARAGLTRGALYHHFGDKTGLFFAVVQDVDREMERRLADVAARASTSWQAFTGRCRAYLAMALEPEIQRIVLRDAPSVLDEARLEAIRQPCVTAVAGLLQGLMDKAVIAPAPTAPLARLINGGLMDSALWIARSSDSDQALAEALAGLEVLLAGLRLPGQ